MKITHGVESLHNHTTLSDGELSHAELFDLAEQSGMSILAFTDHDALPDEKTVQTFAGYKDRSLKYIWGIEMTVYFPAEVSTRGTFHLLGLFVDPFNEALKEHCQKMHLDRRLRAEGIVKNLKNLGFQIEVEDCLNLANGDSVGRPHVVQALNLYPENQKILLKIKEEMAEEAKRDSTVAKRYEEMLSFGENSYPYHLLLGHNAYRKCLVEHSYIVSLKEATELIHQAGGLSFLAHYFTVAKLVPLEMIKSWLAGGLMDGMEIVYGSDVPKGFANDAIHEERKNLIELTRQLNCPVSGGGDIHTQKGLLNYLANESLAGESVGLTERILKNFNPRPPTTSISF